MHLKYAIIIITIIITITVISIFVPMKYKRRYSKSLLGIADSKVILLYIY
jgi:hypothetical protein